MIQKFSQRLDWGPEFWLFALRDTLWPPFAWEITSRLQITRSGLARRFIWVLFGYTKIAVLALLCYLVVRSASNGDWLLTAILVLPTFTSLVVIVIRVQATYLASQETQT